MVQLGSAVGVAVLGVIFFGLVGARADAASAEVAPELERNLVAAGLPADAASESTDGFRICFHDRANAKDPTVVPPSCAQPGTVDVPPQIDAVVTEAAVQAARADFAGSMQRTLLWDAGFFAAAGLLVIAMPRRSRTEPPP